MADEQPIGADDVARKQFATTFRGFDQHEVRAFLTQVAAELAALHEREKGLRERLAAAEAPPPPREVGEDELEAALGVETTRVLHAAREAAAEIRARAEESVARLLREANDEAARMRTEAETVLSRRSEEAETAAAAILASAEEAAAVLRVDAEASATAAVESAQQQGREMVAEAQVVRERVLKDLARRRKAAATQLEQLLAGRERLLRAYDVVRGTLDEATQELTVAESEARQAADAAGLRPPPEDEPAAEVAPEPEPEPVPEPEVAEVVPTPEPEPPADAPAEHVSVVGQLAEGPEAAPAPDDDRRSSSLRLLRRRAETPEVPLLEETESVRIIRPEPAAAMPRPVAVPDLPPEPEPEPEPEVAEAPAADPDAPAEEDAERPVDDLFARLRADRAAAVAKAQVVLAEAEAATAEDPLAVAERAAEPEPEPEPEVTGADAVFEARDAAVEPVERALTRAMKRALADEQNEVLDALRRLRGTPRIEALLPDPAAHVDRFAAAATEHLRSGAAAGSGDGDVPDVGELAGALGAEVADDLRARLQRALDASSGDEETLVEAISAAYREWKSSRAEPLARHHAAAAYALGAFAATEAGDLRWVVDTAEGGCPDCDDNALAGPTRKGQAFPTGQPHPPAHAGCRCLVLPAS